MNLEHPATPQEVQLRHDLEHMRNDWWWFLVLGIATAVLGAMALGSAFFVSIFTVVFFGLLLLVAGIGQIVSSFWTGRWRGFFLHLSLGVLYAVVGLLIIDSPVEATLAMSLLVAAMLLVGGALRLVVALTERFSGWGWTVASGVISLLLGLMIYRQWPASGEWVIGLFLGVELIFAGAAWIMFALGLRELKHRE